MPARGGRFTAVSAVPAKARRWAALGAAAFLGTAVLAGCNVTHPNPTGPTTTEVRLGETATFSRIDNHEPISSVTITDVVVAPLECIGIALPGTAFAVRFELVDNDRPRLDPPSPATVRVKDSQGVTQDVTMPPISTTCADQRFAPIAASAPGRHDGWVLVQTRQPNPSAIVFLPTIRDDSTADVPKIVVVDPKSVVVHLPDPIPGLDTPFPLPPEEPTTTTAAPTRTPVAPVTPATPTTPSRAPVVSGSGCDPKVDTRAMSTDGQPVTCTYAGTSTPRWVPSAPVVGQHRVGEPCSAGQEGIAVAPDGQQLVCVGDRGKASWQPGP